MFKPEKILPKKNWFKDFEKFGCPTKKQSSKELQNFIKERLENCNIISSKRDLDTNF